MNRSPAGPVYSDNFTAVSLLIQDPTIAGNFETPLASRVGASYDSKVGFAIK